MAGSALHEDHPGRAERPGRAGALRLLGGDTLGRSGPREGGDTTAEGGDLRVCRRRDPLE